MVLRRFYVAPFHRLYREIVERWFSLQNQYIFCLEVFRFSFYEPRTHTYLRRCWNDFLQILPSFVSLFAFYLLCVLTRPLSTLTHCGSIKWSGGWNFVQWQWKLPTMRQLNNGHYFQAPGLFRVNELWCKKKCWLMSRKFFEAHTCTVWLVVHCGLM